MDLVFFTHAASLYLLVGACNPLTFKVIIHMYVPLTIFLIGFLVSMALFLLLLF